MSNHISKCCSAIAGATIIGIFSAGAATQITIERNQSPAQAELPLYYQFGTIPGISGTDLANGIAPLTIGIPGPTSGLATKLTDGVGAAGVDDPGNNFSFADIASATPKIISLDLGAVKAISQVNTYSWHHGNGLRAPQSYSLYVSTGAAIGFDPGNFSSPGWTLLTTVNSTLPGGGAANAGQQGVSISDSTGLLGNYRFVGLDVHAPFAPTATFYSEIDVVAVPEPAACVITVLGLMGAGFFRGRNANFFVRRQ